MQSIGLALTLSLLTGAFVTLDLTGVQAGSAQQAISPAIDSSNTLAIMPNRVPGIVPKADIHNGVFAAGSSIVQTEGEDDEEDSSNCNADDESSDPPATRVGNARDFILI